MRFLLAFRFTDYTFRLVLLSGSEKAGTYARWDRPLPAGEKTCMRHFLTMVKRGAGCSSPHLTGGSGNAGDVLFVDHLPAVDDVYTLR